MLSLNGREKDCGTQLFSRDEPFTAADFRDAFRRHLESRAGQVVLRVLLSPAAKPVELTGRDLLEQSVTIAERHCQAPERSVVLLLFPHSLELFLLHIGLLLTGRVPAILAWPTSRVDPQKYQTNLLHQLQNLPAAELLTLPSLARNLAPGLPYAVTAVPCAALNTLDGIFALDLPPANTAERADFQTRGDAPGDALFLQFSGGTTGAQKCVVVTARMLAVQLGLLANTLDFGSADSVVSWLPMYHDMGLIACLWLPLWTGVPSLHFSAQDWLIDPGLLFRLIDRFRATFCWLPNFAFSYLAAQRARIGTASLGHVRAWINCSEPVRRKSMDAFTTAFAGMGVRPEQCQACYAMAENVFAVTQTKLASVAPTIYRSRLSGRSNNAGELAFDLVDDLYVSSGTVLDGMQVRIRNKEGGLCRDLEAGGIEIQTPSIFSGYWSIDGFTNRPSTSDGWYITGDYGFLLNSELFVIGRTKDIVIVGGQNIFPEDVEVLANAVPGVYPGRVAAFGIADSQQGTENLVVVAEMRGEFDATEAKRLEREISHAIHSGIGIAPRFARVTPEHWIVKSTAGKISRTETRARFVEEISGALSDRRPL